MIRQRFLIFVCMVSLICIPALVSASVPSSDGVFNTKSKYNVADTVERAKRIIRYHGFRLLGEVNHGKRAKSVGTALAPTRLIVFGNPQTDSKLMRKSRLMGLDLPMKLLIWEDDAGIAWVSYNSAEYLALRHRLSPDAAIIIKTAKVLRELGAEVAK